MKFLYSLGVSPGLFCGLTTAEKTTAEKTTAEKTTAEKTTAQ